jgi:hypothetical protein
MDLRMRRKSTSRVCTACVPRMPIIPFAITEIIGQSKMLRRLELPAQLRRVHPVFHVSLLIPYWANELEGREVVEPPTPEVLDNGDLGYVVSKIIHSKVLRSGRSGKKTQYLVRFKGYGDETNEWVSPAEFDHDDRVVAELFKRYPHLPQPGRQEYSDA